MGDDGGGGGDRGVVAGKAIRLPAAPSPGTDQSCRARISSCRAGVEGKGFPGWLIQIVQLFVGITLGIRFLGRSPIINRGGRQKVSAVAVFAVLCLAGVASALLSGLDRGTLGSGVSRKPTPRAASPR